MMQYKVYEEIGCRGYRYWKMQLFVGDSPTNIVKLGSKEELEVLAKQLNENIKE